MIQNVLHGVANMIIKREKKSVKEHQQFDCFFQPSAWENTFGLNIEKNLLFQYEYDQESTDGKKHISEYCDRCRTKGARWRSKGIW